MANYTMTKTRLSFVGQMNEILSFKIDLLEIMLIFFLKFDVNSKEFIFHLINVLKNFHFLRAAINVKHNFPDRIICFFTGKNFNFSRYYFENLLYSTLIFF